MSRRYDSDKDIADKIRKMVINSDKIAKKTVTKAAKYYADTIRLNAPVAPKKTHSTHAVEVIKISNFIGDSFIPTKEVGFDKGKSRKDSGWYIHFPDIGTQPKNTVGQPPQHFMRRSQELAKAPIYDMYYRAAEDMFDVK